MQYSQIHQKCIYGIRTDCSLFAKFFPANSFTFTVRKFPPAKLSSVATVLAINCDSPSRRLEFNAAKFAQAFVLTYK